MERGLGIFATQTRSDMVQNMIAASRFGHQEKTWKRRALIAIPDAGIEGLTLTTLEMEAALFPLIGKPRDRCARAAMVTDGCRIGIMREVDEKRQPEGYHQKLRAYEIIGHLDDNEQPVLMGEIRDV